LTFDVASSRFLISASSDETRWLCNSRDGFYTGSGHDMLLKPSTSKGGHGFDP